MNTPDTAALPLYHYPAPAISTPKNDIDMATLCGLWNKLADVPVNESDEIDENFGEFPAGTPVTDVWSWFEEKNPQFSVGLAGQYIGNGHPFMHQQVSS